MNTFLLLLAAAGALAAQNTWDGVMRLTPGQTVLVSYAKSFAEGPLVEATAERVVVKQSGRDVRAARVDAKKNAERVSFQMRRSLR